MIKRIYLDLDDVLNTLVPSALSHIGIDCPYEKYPREHGWSITGAASQLSGREYRAPVFWNRFGREFWATIPKSAECDWLVKKAEGLVGGDCVWILTKAVGADSLAGKQDWVDRHLPRMRERMITCTHKDCCAASDSLLVDDNQDNVQAFVRRGGYAIMRPRPWNDLWKFGDAGGRKYLRVMLNMFST